jgi:hypothetical protein
MALPSTASPRAGADVVLGGVRTVDTCGGTQRQYPQAHGYRSSFHPEVFQVSYPQGNVCVV